MDPHYMAYARDEVIEIANQYREWKKKSKIPVQSMEADINFFRGVIPSSEQEFNNR